VTPYYERPGVVIYNADCRIAMSEMEPESIDAIVCDPPYGLEFMGKEWDRLGDIGKVSHGGIPKYDGSTVFGRAARVNFNGSSNVRCRNCGKWKWGHTEGDAGGGGKRCHCDKPDFPSARPDQAKLMQEWHEAWAREALRVLKPGGHLLAFGGSRTFHRLTCAIEDAGFEIRDCLSWLYGSGFPKSLDVSKAIDKAAGVEREVTGPGNRHGGGSNGVYAQDAWTLEHHGDVAPITAPATDAAKQWEGWGTALKPAWEPIIMARKPLQGTVAENVQRYGTGAINVDGCRIEHTPGLEGTWGAKNRGNTRQDGWGFRDADGETVGTHRHPAGRWPANVCLDEDAAALLDQMSGELKSSKRQPHNSRERSHGTAYSVFEDAIYNDSNTYGDTGGASRFFYTAKASRSERGEGNSHPTVKPLALMRWLVAMVTPPDGCVLDPFMGSGTTLLAAKGFRAIGIEMDESYCAIAANRLGREVIGQSELL